MKTLMLGNEAVARGLYEAGVRVISSYPGTPSTEITEFAATYDELYAEWAPNEKVAVEVAIGASFGGARAFAAMKHVGLNVAADPLYTASYTGVNGGLVIAVADDPGMHSSQNEQDTRNHAIGAKLPVLEPSNSAECKEFTKLAFELSEKFDTPVILRLTTRVSHSQSLVETMPREELPLREYVKNPQKYVMMPAMAIARRFDVEKRQESLVEYAESTPVNRVEMKGSKIGIITNGISYEYAKEGVPDASILKLGMTNPLPVKLIQSFAKNCDTVYVAEELDPVIENHCRRIGVSVKGKEVFPFAGELSATILKSRVLGEKVDPSDIGKDAPKRPPVLCPGCPHRAVFYTLSKLGLHVSGDIGCYTLGTLAPLSSIDSCVCMGASVSAAHGFELARGRDFSKKMVAVIGESTFVHSGITGLIDIVYNKGNSTVIILDNAITGMTGHQQNPTTGLTLKNEPTHALDLEKLCQSVGVAHVTTVDPYDLPAFEAAVKEAIACDGASVVIAKRPCALLKYVKHNTPVSVDREKCKSCKKCMKLGCPAISMEGGKAKIDETLCNGCDLCVSVCPFGAIGREGE